MEVLNLDTFLKNNSEILYKDYTFVDAEAISKRANELFWHYCETYQGPDLSDSWVKRKGLGPTSFWKGLGYQGKLKNREGGMFFQLFDLTPTPKEGPNGEEVYQLDYFELDVADNLAFKCATSKITERLLIHNNISFDRAGEATTIFAKFITMLLIMAAYDLGLGE